MQKIVRGLWPFLNLAYSFGRRKMCNKTKHTINNYELSRKSRGLWQQETSLLKINNMSAIFIV